MGGQGAIGGREVRGGTEKDLSNVLYIKKYYLRAKQRGLLELEV